MNVPHPSRSASPPLAILVTGLRKSFGGQAMLSRLDLAVTEGTVFTLLGPNGSGKTTVRILSTPLAADGGTACIGGTAWPAISSPSGPGVTLGGQQRPWPGYRCAGGAETLSQRSSSSRMIMPRFSGTVC